MRALILGLAVAICSFSTPVTHAQCFGDFDCSGTVDGADLAIFADHYGSMDCAGWLGQVIGTVQCPDGGPIAGATVFVPGDSFVSITDDFGQFKLRALPDGIYTIAVRLAGEEIGREEDVLVESDTTTILSIDSTICDEFCDGLDNDFDGLVDEDLVPEPCPLQQGVCAGAVKICGGAAGWLPCEASTYGGSYEPSETLCDNLDNDCDGVVDGMEQTCGTDGGACMSGVETCTGGVWGACVGEVGPSPEICDGIDNDCDGIVDEDFNLGSPCGVGECSDGYYECSGDGTGAICSTMPGGPSDQSAQEICDGKDNDCDGETDEGCPLT